MTLLLFYSQFHKIISKIIGKNKNKKKKKAVIFIPNSFLQNCFKFISEKTKKVFHFIPHRILRNRFLTTKNSLQT